MLKKIKHLILRHCSLLVMAIGSLSIFIASIGFKSFMSIEDYYQYSFIITVLSLLSSFGALGVDQVFLRLSELSEIKKIICDIKLIRLVLIASFLSSLIFSFYLKIVSQTDFHIFILFLLCLGSVFIMLLYNVFRLKSDFFISQLVQNSWKIFLGVTTIIFYINGFSSHYITVLTVFIWVVLLFLLYVLNNEKSIEFNNKLDKREIYSYTFHFFIALLTLSFLAQGDRLLVENLFTKEEFGDYFYLGTIFLFPFSLLQSYVGFKELVYIKNEKINVISKLKKIVVRSLLLSLVLLIVGYILTSYGVLEINFKRDALLILIFIFIGNLKMTYSLFSAMIGAKAHLDEIKKMNIIFITFIMLGIVIFYFINKTVFTTILFFSSLWLIRTIIWGYYSNYRIK